MVKIKKIDFYVKIFHTYKKFLKICFLKRVSPKTQKKVGKITKIEKFCEKYHIVFVWEKIIQNSNLFRDC